MIDKELNNLILKILNEVSYGNKKELYASLETPLVKKITIRILQEFELKKRRKNKWLNISKNQ